MATRAKCAFSSQANYFGVARQPGAIEITSCPEYSLPDILERLPSRCDEANCGEFVADVEDVGRAKSDSR
jgi:hypothetical protein